MIRLSLYICIGLIIALGAAWIAAHPGQILLQWQAWEIRLSLATFIALFILYTLGFFAVLRLLGAARHLNPLNSAARQEKRRLKGEQELASGWSALSIGDQNKAQKMVRRAKAHLGEQPSVLMLSSQAAEGEDKRKLLDQLNQHDDSRVFALRGLLDLARQKEDWPIALAYANELNDLVPGNKQVLKELLDLKVKSGQWTEATETLKAARKAKAFEMADADRLAAVLDYTRALEQDVAGHHQAGLDLAQSALKQDPSFMPAAHLAARIAIRLKDMNKARKIIEHSWKITPHPDIAELFLKLEPMENATERFRRVQKLTTLYADHPLSAHFLADVAIQAGHWPEARNALQSLINAKKASRKTYTLLAQLEEAQKQDSAAASKWRAKADNAKAEPTWTCYACQHTSPTYHQNCPNCGTFDGLRWG